MALPAIGAAVVKGIATSTANAESARPAPQTSKQRFNRSVSSGLLPGTALGEKLLGPAAGNPFRFALNQINRDDEDDEGQELLLESQRLQNTLNQQQVSANVDAKQRQRAIRRAFARR